MASGPTVTITSPTSGQTFSTSTTFPIRITTTGMTGTLRYYIAIDGTQRWYWNTTATSITQYWTTTGTPAGTHTISVRVVEVSSGRQATASVSVVLR